MKKTLTTALLILLGFIAYQALACTTAIISAEASATGRPILWKQRDTKDGRNHVQYLQGEKYSFTALVTTKNGPVTGIWGGANEKGFVIANNLSYNISKESKGADNGMLMMEALGLCATVDEFEAFLKTVPATRPVKSNFAVIDAQGGAAYFEYGYGKCTRYDAKDAPGGYIYRTNFSLSGIEDKGQGYIRYEAAKDICDKKGKDFTVGWIMDNLARSFYHGLMKTDLKDKKIKDLGEGFVIDQDYIPRFTSVSSIAFEGVNPGEDPANIIMWSSIGYPPCSYAIPAWVGAKDQIPTCLTAKEGQLAPANDLALKLKDIVFPITRGSGEKYIDYLTLRRDILPEVMSAEDKEIKAAQKLQKQFLSTGFDLEAVKQFNAEADSRFDTFSKKMNQLL